MADVGEARLAYWDTGGTGQAVVLLHPATGSKDIWAYQRGVFASAGFRVIGYSRRGHAGSDRGPDESTVSAADDLKALADHLDLDRFHLLGSAAGGFVVPDFALSYPDRLLSMTIACSQGGGADPAYREAIRRISAPGFSEMPSSFRELGPSYRAANPEGMAIWEALEHASKHGERIRQPTRNTLTWEALSKIQTRALVFTGAADLYLPPALMLQYASNLPNVQTAIISEAGHSAYWEQPEAFNSLVLGFLQS
ncbi:alpha/beta hydrolase [Brevundimonas sp.]|uniref:alpha/beta fold hydrolase n=1 Tax=Brevundimonas sp. TaxID=1871086 RepID=UPI00262E73B1|nr:alpha/beta hydrolase [Brevundimonas sp.]